MDITSYLLGKQSGGGGGSATLQTNKAVTITTNGETEVNPDEGYDGLKKATVTTNVQPNLESKQITISSNTTTTISPTQGKDGLSSVEVITQVPGIVPSGTLNITSNNTYDVTNYASAEVNVQPTPPTYNYISNGMVAWFDEDEEVGADEKWYNKVGNDYIYVKTRMFGTSVTNPYRKVKGESLNNYGIFTFATSEDYYKEGYTIEIVATSYNKNSVNLGGWFITGNITGTSGIGIVNDNNSSSSTSAPLQFLNAPYTTTGSPDTTINFGSVFGASVNFQTLKPRSYFNSYRSVIKGSVNGSEYFTGTETSGNSKNSRGNELLILAYYSGNYVAYGSVKCIRIYNRELTEAEKNHNFEIDQTRFNIS